MKVIESVEEVNWLKDKLETEVSIWYPLWVDNTKHPLHTNLSLILVRCLDGLYVLPIQHADALTIKLSHIESIINTAGEKWTFQKKKVLQSLNVLVNLFDVDSAYFIKTSEVIDYETPLNPILSTLTHKGYKENLIQWINCVNSVSEARKKYLDQLINNNEPIKYLIISEAPPLSIQDNELFSNYVFF